MGDDQPDRSAGGECAADPRIFRRAPAPRRRLKVKKARPHNTEAAVMSSAMPNAMGDAEPAPTPNIDRKPSARPSCGAGTASVVAEESTDDAGNSTDRPTNDAGGRRGNEGSSQGPMVLPPRERQQEQQSKEQQRPREVEPRRVEPRSEPRREEPRRAEPRNEPRNEPRSQPRAEPRNEPRSQPRAEPAREKPRNEPEVRRRKP